MSGTMENRVALVTGASSGIGRAAAQIFSREGAKVVVSDINIAGGEETVELIKAKGGDATFIKCDVSKGPEVEALVKNTVATYGKLDAAFNNAGIEGDSSVDIVRCSEATFDQNISVNLKGVWWCIKYEILQMLEQENGGAIVNTSSLAGLVGLPRGNAYIAAKHGVVGLTKAAAIDFARKKIRVNAVCPGAIETPMLHRITGGSEKGIEAMKRMEPVGRLGQPSEIAEAAVWLCSDQASFITGHAMPVDGGAYAV